MKTKKKILQVLKIVFLGTGSILIIVSLFLLFQGEFFKINQVTCYENDHPCSSDLWFKVSGLVLGKNIISLSPQIVEEKIKNELVTIDEVKIQKKLPNILTVHLSRKRPLAVVETRDGYYQVDYQGTILAILDQPTDLPLVTGGQLSLSADGKKIDSPSILTSLDCLYQLLFRTIEVRRAEIGEANLLTLSLKKGPTVEISLSQEVKKQVDSLQLILERAKIEGKQIEVIDLRFDKPVVTYL